MDQDFLPFAKPSISQAAIDEVVACLQSGWITTGPRVQQFTALLKNYLSAPHALPLASATAGLELALSALQLQPGDEVIVSALTFVASLNTIINAGGKPVIVDIDRHTRNMDVTRLEQAIKKNTRAIMPVHFAGSPVDLDPVYELANKYHLRVIEDAAQAIGTEYKGQRLGSFGDTQVFSFHPNKNMTTGEGGCVTTRDEALARHVAVMRFHGIDRDAFNRFTKEGQQGYDVIAPGYKYNMTDIQGALGIHQLPALDSFIKKRTFLAQRYHEQLSTLRGIQLPQLPPFDCLHSWHLYTVLIEFMDRDQFIKKMKALNIGIGLHYEAVHLYSYYRNTFGYQPGDFPEAEYVSQRIVSLPLFPDMTIAQQDRVVAAMRLLIEEHTTCNTPT